MTIHDDAIARIERILPGTNAARSGMCVRVNADGASTYVLPESLQGLTDGQAAGLVAGMLWGVRA